MTDPRADYDAVAQVYQDLFENELDRQPAEAAALLAFADAVRGQDNPVLLDVGCGPGHVAKRLAGAGLRLVGVDLSGEMVTRASQACPDGWFIHGSLLDLPIVSRSAGAVLSRYSLIHLPPEQLRQGIAELVRVLAPGGRANLSFFGAEDAAGHGERFDHTASAPAYRWWAETVASMLVDEGMASVSVAVWPPQPGGRDFDHATVTAQRS